MRCRKIQVLVKNKKERIFGYFTYITCTRLEMKMGVFMGASAI